MSQRSTSARRRLNDLESSGAVSSNGRVEQLRPREERAVNQPVHTARPQNEWVIRYSQGDVETIRSQIIQGESLKRRWLVLALLLTTAGLVTSLVILSSSYALYSRTDAANEQLTLEKNSISQRASELQQTVDARTDQDAIQERAAAEANESLNSMLPSVMGDSMLSTAEGGRFARTVHQLGGRFETKSKPPDKLFRNWKVTTSTITEIYTVVGGFVDGNWLVYSNLVARRQNDRL